MTHANGKGRPQPTDALRSTSGESTTSEDFKLTDDSKDAMRHAVSTPLLLDLIPLHGPRDVDAKGRPVGKAPLRSGWRREAPLSEGEARAHSAKGMNLGARLRDDQLVVDADPRNYERGDDPLARLRRDVGLPDGPTVETGGGGVHIYLRKPEGMRVRDALDEYRGVEFKTLGRQVLVPPSVHPNGRPYAWDPLFGPDMAVPEAPKALLDLIRRPSVASAEPDGALSSEELSKLLEGLDARDYGTNELWLPIAMACHHATAGAGVDAFLDWCATDPDYADRLQEARARWQSFGADRPSSVTRLTLYRALHEVGRGDLVEEVERSAPEHDFPDDVAAEAEPAPKARDLIDEMNERFCVVLDGGKFAVFMEDVDHQTFKRPRRFWTKISRADFLHFHEDERVGQVGSKREVSRAEVWLASPRRRKYPGIVMDPEGRHGDKLNLWRGWAVAPKPGDWSLMRELIERVLCSGDRASSEYVLKWVAFLFQHPGDLPGTSLVFRGEEGVGKGTFATALMDIAGSHGLTVSSAGQLAGRFNAHLRDVVFLFADEVKWTANRGTEGVLKQLVTEPVIAYEGKGADIVSGRNLVHMVMASNNDWVVPAGLEARRFAVFDVSDERRNDHAFFGAVRAQMRDGGLAAMLHDLLAMDLGNWRPSMGVPKTQALADQKVLSLEPASRWWMGLLDRGALPTSQTIAWDQGPVSLDPVSKRELLEDYDRYLKANRSFGANATHKAIVAAGRSLGLDPSVKSRCGKERLWTLPSLEDARRAFESRLGASGLFDE